MHYCFQRLLITTPCKAVFRRVDTEQKGRLLCREASPESGSFAVVGPWPNIRKYPIWSAVIMRPFGSGTWRMASFSSAAEKKFLPNPPSQSHKGTNCSQRKKSAEMPILCDIRVLIKIRVSCEILAFTRCTLIFNYSRRLAYMHIVHRRFSLSITPNWATILAIKRRFLRASFTTITIFMGY